MFALIGEDSPLCSASIYNDGERRHSHSDEGRPLHTAVAIKTEEAGDISNLLDELVRMSYSESTNGSAEQSLVSNEYFPALRSLLNERKRSIVLPFVNTGMAKLQSESLSLDESMNDCLASIAKMADDSETTEFNELQTAVISAQSDIPKHLDRIREEYDRRRLELISALRRHERIRPVSEVDFHNAEWNLNVRQQFWSNTLKNTVCNYAMRVNAHLIKRQRRRNFPKKASQILNKYFETHMNSPYPDEITKARLARACGISITQIANWFGNKRIRFKKSLHKESPTPKSRRSSNSRR